MKQLELLRPRCQFYLGIKTTAWLVRGDVKGPVFVLVPVAAQRKSAWKWGEGVRRWNRAHDSRAFNMLDIHGRWTVDLPTYVEQDKRINDELGPADFSAPQDYMCENRVLAKTGLTVRQHQLLTLSRYRRLRELAPDANFIPVLQGWTLDDYKRHIDDYQRYLGINLSDLPLVGVGSTCRRQGTKEGGKIYRMIYDRKIRLHIFGASLAAAQTGQLEGAVSADSQAWSYAARKQSKAAGGDPGWSANSPVVGEIYRDRMDGAIDQDPHRMKDARERWQYAMTLQHPKNRAA